ncbi:MAG: EscU/YscU/HrcU family type III secretion system export apparatus switch protein [Bdellovibrionales bacterium]
MKETPTYEPAYGPIPTTLERSIAVAIKNERVEGKDAPKVTASGRGKLAEQILAIAFEKGIKVRQDADLVELLSTLDLDTPIPAEAIVVVAEILTKVYQLNASITTSQSNA